MNSAYIFPSSLIIHNACNASQFLHTLKIQNSKAAGPTGVVSEMMKAAGGFGSRWMTDLINNIVKEGCIPDDWRKSILVPVYKGKGDPLVCGSYRAIKLLEQPMKVLERVLEKRIRCQVSIDNMQFGFMPGKYKRNTKQRSRSCTMILWI